MTERIKEVPKLADLPRFSHWVTTIVPSIVLYFSGSSIFEYSKTGFFPQSVFTNIENNGLGL